MNNDLILYLFAAEALAIGAIVRRDRRATTDAVEHDRHMESMAELRAAGEEQYRDPETLRFLVDYRGRIITRR